MLKPSLNGHTKNEIASIVANIHGVTADYVRKVKRGERNNDEVLATLIEYEQGKTQLIKALEELVPLESKKRTKSI